MQFFENYLYLFSVTFCQVTTKNFVLYLDLRPFSARRAISAVDPTKQNVLKATKQHGFPKPNSLFIDKLC